MKIKFVGLPTTAWGWWDWSFAVLALVLMIRAVLWKNDFAQGAFWILIAQSIASRSKP